jgi:hypothetical protein
MAMIHVSRSGATLGVFDEARVREGLTTGEFISTDLGWTEGMATWRPLSELESFQTAATPPPPVVPPLGESGASSVAPAELVVSGATTGAARTGLPWENRESTSFFTALFETIVMVLTKPNEAFRIMRREGGLGDPVLYMLIMGTAGAVISFVYSTFLQMLGIGAGGDAAFGRLLGIGATSFVALIMMPVFVLVGLFIGAAIVHVCLMIVGGANQSFETTLRVIAYGNGSASVFRLVPFCGGLIAAIYGLVVNCIGLAQAHETDTWRAVVAILLPVVVCCGGFLFLFLAILGGVAGMADWR